MIERNLLESAKYIRNEFESLLGRFNQYEKQAKDLKEFFDRKCIELSEINKSKLNRVKTKGDIEIATQEIFAIINEIEQESEKIARSLESTNTKLESIKKEESILYEKIKEKYPELSDERIRDQVWEFLKTNP